jgi:YhcH/YjgK/YiaL family protein
MILDSLDNYCRYINLHPAFKKVFTFLCNTDFSAIEPGKIIFDNEPFYVNVDENMLRDKENAFLEVHNEYIDIQIPLIAKEQIGYSPRKNCKEIREEYPERDILFYNDRPEQIFTLFPGNFAVFFPEDAHAPLIGEGKTKKIIAKVKIVNN